MSWAWFKAKGSNTQKGQNTEEEGLLRAPRAQVPMWLSSHPELGQGGALAATEQDSLQRAPSSDLCQEGCTPPGSFLHSRLTQQELPSRGSGLSESLQPPPLRPASLVEAGREGKEEVAERSPRLCKEPVWGEEKVLRKGVSPETWEVLLSPEGLPVLGLLEWDGGGALPALRVCVCGGGGEGTAGVPPSPVSVLWRTSPERLALQRPALACAVTIPAQSVTLLHEPLLE